MLEITIELRLSVSLFLIFNYDKIMSGLLGALTGGLDLLGGVAGDLINANATQGINRENTNNSWAMWRANNDYNAPLAQMKRLKDAGLNPNLVYGGGATTVASQPTVPKLEVPHYDSPARLGQSATVGMNTAVSTQQLDNMKQQEELTQAQIENTRADTANKPIEGMAVAAGAAKTQTEDNAISSKLAAEVTKLGSENTNLGSLTVKNKADANLADANSASSRSLLAPTVRGVRLENVKRKLDIYKQKVLNLHLDDQQTAIYNKYQADINAAALAGQASKVRTLLDNMERELRSKTGASYHDNAIYRRTQLLGTWLYKNLGLEHIAPY